MKNNDIVNEMKIWRHHLHANPETAFEENKTADYIANILSDLGLEVHRNIGKTGIVANLKCGNSKEVIGLRADMDAINIEETTNLDYQSKIRGKMHACGHDGHVATLLGAAKLLAENPHFNGTVRFIFQPAEEPGKGAKAMIEDGLLERFPIDEIYGIHNMPNLSAKTICTCIGGIMASEDNFTVKIEGKGGHASSPHLGVDPLIIAAEIILAFQTIVSRNMNPLVPAVISCTEIHTDGAHNAIASNVTISGDTRSNAVETQELLEKRMREIVENISQANNAKSNFNYTHEFSPTINWEKCVDVAVKVASKVVGSENVNGNCQPWMASEDFGTFLQYIPGCFVFLGSAKDEDLSKNIPLHNSNYDYNDEVLETGANFFKELVLTRLAK